MASAFGISLGTKLAGKGAVKASGGIQSAFTGVRRTKPLNKRWKITVDCLDGPYVDHINELISRGRRSDDEEMRWLASLAHNRLEMICDLKRTMKKARTNHIMMDVGLLSDVMEGWKRELEDFISDITKRLNQQKEKQEEEAKKAKEEKKDDKDKSKHLVLEEEGVTVVGQQGMVTLQEYHKRSVFNPKTDKELDDLLEELNSCCRFY